MSELDSRAGKTTAWKSLRAVASRTGISKLNRPLWSIATVFLASVLISLIFWIALPTRFRVNENTDYIAFYEPVARNILAGHGPVLTPGTAIATRYPPGYPAILAVIFGLCHFLNISETNGLLAFSSLGLGFASVLLFLIARRTWGRPSLAFLAAATWITYPLALWYTKQPNSEIPFFFVFYAGFYLVWDLLIRKKYSSLWFLIGGLLIGLAMLIRPIAIGVGVVLAAVIWIGTRDLGTPSRLRLITVFFIGTLVVVASWETVVYQKTGEVIPLSSGGVATIRDGLTYAVRLRGYRQGAYLPEDVSVVMRDINTRYDELNSLSDVAAIISDELKTHPLAVAKLFALKAARSWYGTDSQRLEFPIILIQVLYLSLIIWASRIAWKLGGFSKQMIIAVWLIAAYFWAMTVISLSIQRYMVPAMGLLFTVLPALLAGRLRDKVGSGDGYREHPEDAGSPILSSVTVIMPVRNEAGFIEHSLGAVLSQDYPHEQMEVVLTDGMSTDATREAIARTIAFSPGVRVVVLDNPGMIAASGLNVALYHARGEIIIRVDGHTIVAPDYVKQCVAALNSHHAQNVGGPMKAIGTSPFARAVSLATSSYFGVGGARFHYADREEWVDTVYLGAWPRELFGRIGAFDEEMVRNQDDEFNYRLLAHGGKVLLSPKIKSRYFNRTTMRSLLSQYFQYGYWKVRVFQKHPRQMKPRQFAPLALVTVLLASGFAAPFSALGRMIGVGVLILYIVANLSASLRVCLSKHEWRLMPLVAPAFAALHFSYGLGFLIGLIRFGNRWRDRQIRFDHGKLAVAEKQHGH